jgi:branched-chain amino acid transport system ATP-binding protein
MPDAPLLSVSEACVRFGGVDALIEVDFAIEAGTVTALIGPNGAGKTTLLGAVTGMVPMHRGRVVLAGRDVTACPPCPGPAGWCAPSRTWRSSPT